MSKDAPLASMQPNACFTKAYYKCNIPGVSAITSEKEREGDKDRQTETERARYREREREKETDRQTDRETDGQRERTLVPEIT